MVLVRAVAFPRSRLTEVAGAALFLVQRTRLSDTTSSSSGWRVAHDLFGLGDMDEAPFKTVLIHGLARATRRDARCQELGNGIDPLDHRPLRRGRVALHTGDGQFARQRYAFSRMKK